MTIREIRLIAEHYGLLHEVDHWAWKYMGEGQTESTAYRHAFREWIK